MSEPDSRVFCPTCFQSFPLGTERCPADGASLVGLPREATLEGTVLDGKYDVFEQLGRGGMGTVYRAVQKLIEREVALKILRTDFTSDLQAVKRFFREAKAVARLRSPNAVILYDFGLASEGHLYYTMELVRGRSLARELKEQGAFPVKRATRIALQVARALEEAHGLGIIHRDLKPSNIMLVGAGDGEVAKVLDFGIAKLLSVPEGSTLLTDSGIALGTPKYMSPEQATGGQVDYRSDLYSLGVILYEMLAGLPPFHGGSPSAVMQRQVSEEPVPLRVMAPDVEIPLPLERLLARLLAKRPGERPRRVTDITPELSALAEGVYDSRTTRMPLMATTPGGLRQIVPPGEEGEDPRWGGPTMRVLEDPLAGRREMPPRTAPDAREDGSSTDGTGRLLGLDPGSVRGGEPAGPVPDPEARREGTEDYTKPGDGGDETPIYQPTVGSTPARRQEPWRNPDYIPMDGKDEWTTTSRHIPGMDVEEADPPPHAEWDAPSPAWESPPARKGAAIPRPQERSNRLLAVLVVLLISVTLLAGALHYQLLDGFMARFGLGRPVRLTGEPGPPRPAARPDRRGAEYTSEAVSTGAEDDAGSAAKDVSEPPAERVSGDAAAETAADVPFEAIEQARRQGLQAAGRGDFLEAIGHFERARELGGEPEDLDRLIDECRRKHQEQR